MPHKPTPGGYQPSPGGRAPEPPTTGSGVKPAPPPPRDRMEIKGEVPPADQWWDLNPNRKVGHLQIFNRRGEEIHSSFWQPSGNYRIRIGWFGRAILEEELIFVEDGTPGPLMREWRRAPRGTVAKIMGPYRANSS